ncbi:MAG: hypothetical protein DMG58_37235 [Acidobacteria bacterium]|nr:MAG: hypothetical protein DMG58_37235 [Acidobacteriota bacterium]
MVLEFKPDPKHGPKFRAPNSGYNLSNTQVDSDQKSTFSFCATWPPPVALLFRIPIRIAGRRGRSEG